MWSTFIYLSTTPCVIVQRVTRMLTTSSSPPLSSPPGIIWPLLRAASLSTSVTRHHNLLIRVFAWTCCRFFTTCSPCHQSFSCPPPFSVHLSLYVFCTPFGSFSSLFVSFVYFSLSLSFSSLWLTHSDAEGCPSRRHYANWSALIGQGRWAGLGIQLTDMLVASGRPQSLIP